MTPAPSPPLSRRVLAGVALAAAAAAFAAMVVEPFDPDMFHHLALGREIARHGLRAEEAFLYPMLGLRTGPAAYWLGSLAIHGWHAALGTAGLAFLPALVGALALLVQLADASPRDARHGARSLAAAALPLALAVAAFRHRAMIRPELFAVLFLALTLWAIRRFEDGRIGLLLPFPLLVALWTNVHPSALAGVGLVALFAASGAARLAAARLRGRPAAADASPRRVALAAGLAVAGLAATLLSPTGSGPLRSAIDFVGASLGASRAAGAPAAASAALDLIRRNVTEMAPPGLDALREAPAILLALTAVSFALRWRRPRLRELATFAVFVVLATRAQRFTVLFAILSAPFAARNLGAALAALPQRRGRVPLRALAAAALAAAAVAAVPLAREDVLRFGTALRRGAYPVRALDYLAAIGFDGRVYNSFELGGYVAWRGLPAFQDGRGLLPPGVDAAAAISGPVIRPSFEALDARFQFDALVLSPMYEHARTTPIRPGDDWYADRARWALVAFDDGGVLFLRRDGKYGAIAARDEYAWARPAAAPYQWPRRLVGAVLQDYRRSVAETPDCMLCRFFLASAALAAGQAQEALDAALPVLASEDIQVPNTLPVAAAAAEALGRPGDARRWAERALALRPGDPSARRTLERLAAPAAGAAPAGDVAEAQALLERGVAAYRAGDLVGAIPLLEAAVRAARPNPAAHSNLGYVYLDLGRAAESAREQRAAIAEAPTFGAAHYGLGLALAASGDRAGAAGAFREYLRVEPGGPWATKATQAIAELERR